MLSCIAPFSLYNTSMMTMKHEWKQWEDWEDKELDFETTFDDLMIDHHGNFFGAMSLPDNRENNELRESIERSKVQAARIIGITVEELEEMEKRTIMRALFGETNE